MAAYLIYVRHTLLDPEKYREYIQKVGPVTAHYGGEVVAAAAATETLEGELELPPVTMIHFPSMERLRAWYDSEEYAPLKQLRLESSNGDMLFFEGSK